MGSDNRAPGSTKPDPGPQGPCPSDFDSACLVLADVTGRTPLWECPCAECRRLDLELYAPDPWEPPVI